METQSNYLKMLNAKDEAAKFARLAADLESLINFATQAKDKAEEMESNLKTIAGQYEDAENLDMTNESDVEWSKELTKNIASGESQLADPLKGGKPGYRKPSLHTLLSLIKDYGNYEGFKSALLDRAEVEERAENKVA